jgi:hypothetical protein
MNGRRIDARVEQAERDRDALGDAFAALVGACLASGRVARPDHLAVERALLGLALRHDAELEADLLTGARRVLWLGWTTLRAAYPRRGERLAVVRDVLEQDGGELARAALGELSRLGDRGAELALAALGVRDDAAA